MALNEELGRRLRDARRDFERRHDRPLPMREVGERVGAALGRAAYAAPVVQRWFEGREPDDALRIVAALADVLEVTPWWIAFGAHTGAAVDDEGIPEAVRDLPRITPVDRARPLTDAVVDELQREVAASRPASGRKTASGKARRRR